MTPVSQQPSRSRSRTADRGLFRKIVDMMVPGTQETHKHLQRSLDDLEAELKLHPSQPAALDKLKGL